MFCFVYEDPLLKEISKEVLKEACNSKEKNILAYIISKSYDLIDMYNEEINTCELHVAFYMHKLL